MPVVISHPTGNEFFRAAIKGFFNAGMLGSVYTSLASFPGTLAYTAGGMKMLQDIRRRSFDRELKSLIHTHPWKETGRLLSIKWKRKKWVQHETGIFSVDEVYKSLDRYVARRLANEKAKGATIIYAYEDGAAFSFKKAKELGLHSVYDLPIGYWRTMQALLAAEKDLNPEWAVTLDGIKNSLEKLNRKDEEIALAEKIIVASSFTLKTLDSYPGRLPEVRVVPYGFPAVNEKPYRSIKAHQKLKLLFVGGLSQRKGLSYLFRAVEPLESFVELTIVGRCNMNACGVLNRNLKKHNWIESLPHHKILELMKEHDVLVFPSLFEGFGMVITEAMARGTPVITTERTAGPDIIKNGENGWLINAGSAEALQAALENILIRPHIIAEFGQAALETAAKRPWSVYSRELAQAVNGEPSTVHSQREI